MTLDTRIYVHGRVSAEAAFKKMNEFLSADPARVKCEVRADYIMNLPMQGLAAWLIVYCDPAGEHPYRAAPEECDEWCDPGYDHQHDPACWLEISIDTTYGYDGPEGGCGDLHAKLITQFGHWLTQGDVSWSWQNEFTGEIHQRFEGIEDLGGQGKSASDWLKYVALPAIESSNDA